MPVPRTVADNSFALYVGEVGCNGLSSIEWRNFDLLTFPLTVCCAQRNCHNDCRPLIALWKCRQSELGMSQTDTHALHTAIDK